jgi:hypothetical protein
MSYGAAGVLGALTAAVPRRWRPAWIGWWLAIGAVVVAVGRDFTDAGHVVALALGMLASTRFGAPKGWTRPRVALLAVTAAFGFLLFASTPLVLVIATVLGVLVAANVEIWRAGNACEAPTAHRL